MLGGSFFLGVYPAHTHIRQEMVQWMKLNFLGLFLKSGKDKWNCEISNYYIIPLLQYKFFEYEPSRIFWAIYSTHFCNSHLATFKAFFAKPNQNGTDTDA